MAAEEVAASEETVTEAMEAAVEVAAIEEAEAVAMAETATEATVAAEAVAAIVEAVEVAAAMAETAMEVMVAAMIRDPIKILGCNRIKHCKTLQWLADQQLTIFVIPRSFSHL